LFTAGIVLLAAVLAPTWVQASSISFAQFAEANPGGNLFSYLDNSTEAQFGTSTGGPLGATVPVNFTYLTVGGSLPADLLGNQNATLSMTSSTKGATTLLGGIVGNQMLTGAGTLSDTITITRNLPAAEGNNTRTNLLTLTFTGQLLGVINGRTPQLSSDTGLGAAFTVTYSSDFLTFNNSAEKDFSLTFSSWTNTGDGNGLAQDLISGFFASANASGAGTFDGTATVPEPATWLLGTIGVGLLLIARKQFRLLTLAKCLVHC
jgi:hypothetical protein